MMKVLLIIFVTVLTGCATADLRPEVPPSAEDRDAGVRMLREVADAHGGRKAWLAQRAVRVKMRDQWKSGLTHSIAGPWPKNGTPFELTLIPGADDARLHFLEVDKPDWGVQNWATYKARDGEEPKFTKSGKLQFWVPTTSYFVEAPFRVTEATTVYRIGSAEVDGRTYDRVFATWGDDAPQKNVDQYVVWIDPTTKRIAWLQYTVRDYGRWMIGVMAYEKYSEVGGFTIAREMGTVDGPGGKPTLHRYFVDDIELDADVRPEFVVPQPGRAEKKY